MTIICIIVVWICTIVLAFIAGSLYEMSGYDSIGEWLREDYKLNKEIAQEMKAEKAWRKANPLCQKCLEEGKYRKATDCIKTNNALISACHDHYLEWSKERYGIEKNN